MARLSAHGTEFARLTQEGPTADPARRVVRTISIRSDCTVLIKYATAYPATGALQVTGWKLFTRGGRLAKSLGKTPEKLRDEYLAKGFTHAR